MCILTQVCLGSAAQPTLLPPSGRAFTRLGPSKAALLAFLFPPDKALSQVQSHGWLSLPVISSSQDYSGL